jgi:hypothetical protein
MIFRNDSKATLARFLAVLAGSLALVACGGSSSTPTPTPTPVANTAAVEVNAGPANNSTNMLFVTVTVCLPGTTTCTDVPNVQVDTGSEGLRVLSTALGTLSSSLPTIQDSSSNVLQECIQFADTTYIWGPVATADVEMAGEKASSVPIQVINNPAAFDVPPSCLALGNAFGSQGNLNTVSALGANGIIGLGNFAQDCGGACTSASSNPPPYYFVCPQNVCSIPAVPLNDQLWNPVALFAADNNGVMITMPAIDPGGATTASGSLIFGVGTQTDNALGSATLYATDAYGDIQSSYGGIGPYPAFFDTGSTGIYFLDYATLGIPDCADYPGFYCPASPVAYTVTNTDGNGNGTTGQAQFTIANTDTLFSNTTFAAFNDLGGDSGSGPSSDSVDFGMPFFFGRTVYIGIEGMTVPNGVSAPNGYFAY